MKISTKGRYGLRALIYLGIRYNQEKVSVKEIAETQDISPKYLEQIFSILKKNGIVKSIQGANGGYYLDIDPEELTVYDVLNVLEGEIDIYDEDKNKKYEPYDIEYMLVNDVWKKLNNNIILFLKNIKISDIIKKYDKTNKNMFYI